MRTRDRKSISYVQNKSGLGSHQSSVMPPVPVYWREVLQAVADLKSPTVLLLATRCKVAEREVESAVQWLWEHRLVNVEHGMVSLTEKGLAKLTEQTT